ncbi:UNVERIFIED_CONTAM: hypothetical protein GTU68_034274, partial [Idotea baltica]|nr:hypothetical protein [Idotea baltica]
MVTRLDPTEPSNWRAMENLRTWMAKAGRIGIAGIDTRRVTQLVRDSGMPHAAIAYDPEGELDTDALIERARGWNGLEGTEKRWEWPEGYVEETDFKRKIVAIDYGAKRNILRCLSDIGCDVTVLPASATAEDVLGHEPDGVFLSNGPGDPAATGVYAVPTIKAIVDKGLPIFGVCLGHQMLALALGAKTKKMKHGHHGANHPVKDLDTDKVEITSMNHGFTVDQSSLPDGVIESHVSLFDKSNCGLRVKDKPIFSVQYHPEASPGPRDSNYLFERF